MKKPIKKLKKYWKEYHLAESIFLSVIEGLEQRMKAETGYDEFFFVEGFGPCGIGSVDKITDQICQLVKQELEVAKAKTMLANYHNGQSVDVSWLEHKIGELE